MKFRNPFRTKILIFAHLEYTIIVKVPFLGKVTIRKEKLKPIKGYSAKYIIIDEASEIK